jgi:hypothetical protein
MRVLSLLGLVIALSLVARVPARAADTPFHGKVYDIDRDHADENCQVLVATGPTQNVVLRTATQRILSILISAFEKSPEVSGTYRVTGAENQITSVACQTPPGAADVVYALSFSTSDGFAKVWIGHRPGPLTVTGSSLQQICASSLRTGQPLKEIEVTGQELRRAKLNR